MGRSRASSRAAGTKYETDVSRYLSACTNKMIIRMPKTGKLDKGDIFGLTFQSDPIAVECKSPGQEQSYKVPKWIRETQAETVNSLSVAGILLIKRFRKRVEESMCVLTEEYAQILGFDIQNTPIVKVRGYDDWWENIDNLHTIRIKIRGEEDAYYIVTTLKNIVGVFDIHKEKIDIQLTQEEKQHLDTHSEIKIHPQYPGMPTIHITI